MWTSGFCLSKGKHLYLRWRCTVRNCRYRWYRIDSYNLNLNSILPVRYRRVHSGLSESSVGYGRRSPRHHSYHNSFQYLFLALRMDWINRLPHWANIPYWIFGWPYRWFPDGYGLVHLDIPCSIWTFLLYWKPGSLPCWLHRFRFSCSHSPKYSLL